MNNTLRPTGIAPKGQIGDDLYTFGGSESEVEHVLRPLAERFRAGHLVADLGSGRGTFLQLLRSRGVASVGVDLSDQSVQFCASKGFTAVQADVLEFLEDKHEIYDGILCSHVIEHLDTERAGILIERSFQALKAGGELILLTPNPYDIEVMCEMFWLDPTHVRPYPLPLLDKLFRQIGFDVVVAKRYLGIPLGALPKRYIVRLAWMKLFLWKHVGAYNTLIIGRKSSGPAANP